jgi:hypothetical protein
MHHRPFAIIAGVIPTPRQVSPPSLSQHRIIHMRSRIRIPIPASSTDTPLRTIENVCSAAAYKSPIRAEESAESCPTSNANTTNLAKFSSVHSDH